MERTTRPSRVPITDPGSPVRLATARAGDLLDWSPADKVALIVFTPTFGVLLAYARVHEVLADQHLEPYLDRAWLVVMQAALELILALTAIFVPVWLRVRRRAPQSRAFVEVSLGIWLTALSGGAFLIGHVSTPIFGGLISVVCALLLFFELAQAIRLATWGLLTFFVPLGLVGLGLLPYGPVFREAPFVGQSTSQAWVVSTSVFALGVVLVPAFLLAAVVRRWRARDAALFELARLDVLTRVANRGYFFDRLRLELERASRHGHAVAVLLLDLDHFKRINDQHGHLVGDLALVHVTSLLQRVVLRRVDLVGRYGGEEFAVLLPDTDLEGARVVAERCRHALETTPCQLDDGRAIKLTTSIGVGVPGASHDADALMQRVDAALYRAKEHGRNRVEVAESA